MPALILLATISPGLIAGEPVLAQRACTITQITHSTEGTSLRPSLDGGSIAFVSNADLTGSNPFGGDEIFLFDGSTIRKVSNANSSGISLSASPSLGGGSIAFDSSTDLTGDNPDRNTEIFLFDGSTIRQITHSTSGASSSSSLNGGSIAFTSDTDLTGGNADGSPEIFLFDGSTMTQITHSPWGHYSTRASLDGGSIAFESTADLTGGNPDGRAQIFLFDGSSITQITHSVEDDCFDPDLDGSFIAFRSRADLTGENPQGRDQIFRFNGSTIHQITHATDGFIDSLSLDGSFIAFSSSADLTGGNRDRNDEIFLFDGSDLTQVTNTSSGFSSFPSVSGGSIAFAATADLTGENPDHNEEIFLAICDVQPPAPPPGPYLTSDELPGFRFKVRITSGTQVIAGQKEAGCIGETLCVSGALQGRSELFVRIIGPRPNGFLWLNLVRFTPSRVEVWAEQTATGELNYYDLPALPPADTELTGKVDKEAFLP